jgi:N-carbamoylputrescine amidase
LRLLAAAIQMPSVCLDVAANLDRADAALRRAHEAGAALAVLPEMFNTGYGLRPDYTPYAEDHDGPTIRHLAERSRRWGMAIAAGFVERAGHHLYDSVLFCLPDGQAAVYRKRNLVFWERFRFRPGREPLVVPTPFGRVGFAICADMIYRNVWDGYRDRIDLAIVSAAWPEFACRHTGRKNWLLGHVGPLSGEIPRKVATDLGVPVVFANQCGETHTTIPLPGLLLTGRIADRFAGQSCVVDGRHGPGVRAGADEQLILSEVTIHRPRRPSTCPTTSRSDSAASSSTSART